MESNQASTETSLEVAEPSKTTLHMDYKLKSTNEYDDTIRAINNIHMSVFYPQIPPDPDKDFKKRWRQNVKFLSDSDKLQDQNVITWNVDDVVRFIRSLPIDSSISDVFRNEVKVSLIYVPHTVIKI